MQRTHVLILVIVVLAVGLCLVWIGNRDTLYPPAQPQLRWADLSARPKAEWPPLVAENLLECIRVGGRGVPQGIVHPWKAYAAKDAAQAMILVVNSEQQIVDFGLHAYQASIPTLNDTPPLGTIADAYRAIGASDVAAIVNEAEQAIERGDARRVGELDQAFKTAVAKPELVDLKARYIEQHHADLMMR
jgi:hypothetical protein